MITKVGDLVRAIPRFIEVGKGASFEDTRWWTVLAIDERTNMFKLSNGWWYETTQFEYSRESDSNLAPTPISEPPSRVAYPETISLDIHLSPESASKIRKHLQRLADLTLSRSEKQELDTLISELPI